MANLISNIATMNSSKGVTLLTAGKYIPHNIIVKPNETFTIKDLDIKNITSESDIASLSGINIDSLTLSGKITDLSCKNIENVNRDISITNLNNALTIVNPKNVISINNFENATDNTSVKVSNVEVANESGLITVSPDFSRAEYSVDVSENGNNIEYYETANANAPTVDYNISGIIPETSYKNTYKGWLDTTPKTNLTVLASSDITGGKLGYIKNISIKNGKVLNKLSNTGTISEFEGSSDITSPAIINTITGYHLINVFGANLFISNSDNFTGSITIGTQPGSPELKYDSSTQAIVFTY